MMTVGPSMRAAVVERFGGVKELKVESVPRPTPGTSEILVEIVAAGVNPVDLHNRSDGSWAGIEPPVIIGSDASGIIREIGAGVEGFDIGDEVFYFSDFLGTTRGSYAEYQVVGSQIVSRKPGLLTHLEAAAVPLAAGTAYEVIVRRLAATLGESLIVYGAAGGVGSYAVQLATLAGARVIAVARTEHHEFLRDLGAELTIDYAVDDVSEVVTSALGFVDAAVDLVGGSTVLRSLDIVRPGGRVATICALEGDLGLAIDKNITLHGVLVRPERARLDRIAELLSRGALRVFVREEFGLEEVELAHERLETGHGAGRSCCESNPSPPTRDSESERNKAAS